MKLKHLSIVCFMVLFIIFGVGSATTEAQSLEADVKALKEEVKVLKEQVRTLQDIEQIKTLQRAYGWYYEHGMWQEINDLFADGPDTTLAFGDKGKYVSKKSLSAFWFSHPAYTQSGEYLHMLMQVNPVITVAPDGKTAKGRWYSLGISPSPTGAGGSVGSGVYENKYVKENGVWMIKELMWLPDATVMVGEPVGDRMDEQKRHHRPEYDAPPDIETEEPLTGPGYPSGYIYPFHFTHPVTGKKTTEEERNAKLDYVHPGWGKKMSEGK